MQSIRDFVDCIICLRTKYRTYNSHRHYNILLFFLLSSSSSSLVGHVIIIWYTREEETEKEEEGVMPVRIVYCVLRDIG